MDKFERLLKYRVGILIVSKALYIRHNNLYYTTFIQLRPSKAVPMLDNHYRLTVDNCTAMTSYGHFLYIINTKSL